MLSPRQIFEDNIRPADLLLKVFRLLEHDALNTEEALLGSLRELVKAEKEETLLVISNGIFLGLIRELAEVPPSAIKRSALCNLLRQAVVTASTALETYLPTLLRNNLPEVIENILARRLLFFGQVSHSSVRIGSDLILFGEDAVLSLKLL